MARITTQYAYIKQTELQAPHIFVVDMIPGFCKEGPMSDTAIMDIVPSIIQLLSIPNQVAPPIFFADAHEEDAMEFASFPKHCIKGTREVEIIEELTNITTYDTIFKNSTNGFHEIQPYLQKITDDTLPIKEIIITGCCTDICVMQFALTLKTWLHAQNLPIQVIIPVNCIDTYDSYTSYHPAIPYNTFAISMMEQAGIRIVEGIMPG